MADVEKFKLPRDDWYDEQGRLYKDVIIENLNACEKQLLNIQKFNVIEIEPPDFSKIEYSDSDLDSADDMILNLRSFLNIMDLINYPIELSTSGQTVKKVAFWSSEYKYVVIEGQLVEDISKSKPYVYVDISNNTLKATSDENTAVANIFLGKYENGEIRSIHEAPLANLNLMYLLANMKFDTGAKSTKVSTYQNIYNPYSSKRTAGIAGGESLAGSVTMYLGDYGRKVD